MRWRLALLGLVTAGIVVVLFMPIATVQVVKVDLPPEMHSVSAKQVGNAIETTINVGSYALLAGILALAAWIGVRIVRRHRR